MTEDDDWETGPSGRLYIRKAVLDGLELRFAVPHADVWEMRDLHCRSLAEDVYLPICTLLQDNMRLTRRAAIWQKTADGWKIVNRQGTIV